MYEINSRGINLYENVSKSAIPYEGVSKRCIRECFKVYKFVRDYVIVCVEKCFKECVHKEGKLCENVSKYHFLREYSDNIYDSVLQQ